MMTTELPSLKQNMCVDMVVGPNVEKIDTPTLDQQSDYPDDYNCVGLPYQDHNYGAPLRKFSISSMPPLVEHVDNAYVKPSLPIVDSTNVLPSLRVNGLSKRNLVSKKKLHSRNRKESKIADSISVGDITRCICGYSHDDGYMICCDNCSVWQHIDCVNINRNNIPETYLCDDCSPRTLNKEEAMQLQAKKLHDLSIASEIESSGAESEDDRDSSHITYIATQSTPTSLTITSNRSSKRSDSNGSVRKRKRSRDDSKRQVKKANICERKRFRSTSKGSSSDTLTDDQIGFFAWTNKLKEWNESYREIDRNHYTPELLKAVQSSSVVSDIPKQEGSILEQLRQQLAKVQQLQKKMVMALDDICLSIPVVEVMGSYMLSQQTEAKSEIYKRPYPYLFFYNGFDGVEVVVDSRVVGNVSRYVRRSCRPNSELRHVIDGNQLHLFIYTKDTISNGSEITIPFDFKYQNCSYNVECGCGNFKDCPVYKYTNMRMERSLESTNTAKQLKHKDEESGRVSPLRLSMSRINEHINGYSGSDNDSNNISDTNQDSSKQECLRKKSREDKKIETYIRLIKQMEEKEKKREQLHNLNSLDVKSFIKDSGATENGNGLSQQPSTPNSFIDEEKVALIPAAKRIVRRRSTRTGRRNSKKNPIQSDKSIFSSLSFENNDSNNSTDLLTNSSHTPNSVPEQLSDIVDLNQESVNTWDSDTFCHESDSMVALQAPCVPSVADIFPVGPISSTSVSISHTSSGNTVTNSAPIPVLDKPSTDNAVQNLKDSTKIPSDGELPKISAVSKASKKKQNNGSNDTAPGNCRADSTSTSAILQQLSSLTFTDWEFRPGVPNGKVRIGLGCTRVKRQVSIAAFLKKKWLRLANEEGLISKALREIDINSGNKAQGTYFKKRIMKSYLTNNMESNNNSDLTNVVFNEKKSLSSSHSEQNATLKPNDEIVLEKATLLFEDKLSSSTTVQPELTYPALEYENLSDDEEETQSSTSSVTGVDAVGAVDENNHPDFQNSNCPTQLADTPLDRDYNQRQEYLVTSTDENPVVSNKKKVSIEEYLKRSKKQRKPSSNQPPKSVPSSFPITASNFTTTTADLVLVNHVPTTATQESITMAVTASSLVLSTTPQSVSSISSVTSTPASTSSQSKEVENNDEIQNKEKNESNPSLNNASLTPKETSGSVDLQDILVEAISAPDTALKSLPPSLLIAFNELIKKAMPPSSEDDSPNGKSISTSRRSSEESPKKPTTALPEKSCKSSQAVHKESVKSLGAPLRPSVERSNSSPGIKFTQRPSNTTGHSAKKVGDRQHSSPSSRHSTPGIATHRKGFASPVQTASPRLMRGHSGSSVNSHSPAPTIYDRRHRPEYSSRDIAGGKKSRHNSGASMDSSHSTTKSPVSAPIDNTRTQSKSSNVDSQETKSLPRLQESPQKVASLTPSVAGQPIPSLARGPGTTRVPEVVYNRRSSPPRTGGGSQPWDIRDPPPRSLKDIPFSRQNPYPPRLPSSPPIPSQGPPRDKYYDRYMPPPHHSLPRPRDDHRSPLYYHHPPYHHHISDYRSDRAPFYPPREPRPSPDYYHRSSYYPPPSQDYRR